MGVKSAVKSAEDWVEDLVAPMAQLSVGWMADSMAAPKAAWLV